MQGIYMYTLAQDTTSAGQADQGCQSEGVRMGEVGEVGTVLVYTVYYTSGADVIFAHPGQYDIHSYMPGVQSVSSLFCLYCFLFIPLPRNADIPALVLLPVLGDVGIHLVYFPSCKH